ncbi:hypothetical protein, partial [Staphylococcus massiliensis]
GDMTVIPLTIVIKFVKKGGLILKIVLYFVYSFVSFFILNLLFKLVIPGIDVDVYESLLTALFFAIFMTPFLYISREKGNKK